MCDVPSAEGRIYVGERTVPFNFAFRVKHTLSFALSALSRARKRKVGVGLTEFPVRCERTGNSARGYQSAV